jgi:hypothetical protein
MIRNFSINGLQPYYQGPAVAKYYEMPIVEATTANNSLLVHISIPVGKLEDRYQIYQLAPIPYHFNDITRTWRGPAKTIAVSSQSERWIDLSSTFDVETACWGKQPPICHGRFPESPLDMDPCLTSLFQTDLEPPAACTPAYDGNHGKVHLRHWYSTYWAATLFKPQAVAFRCHLPGTVHASNHNVAPTEGSFVIHLPDVCSMNIGRQRIKAYRHLTDVHINSKLRDVDSAEAIRIIALLLNQTAAPNWTLTSLLDKDSIELLKQDTSLKHLKTVMLQYVNETRALVGQAHPYGHPVNHVVMTGWTLLILVGLGCGLWRCRTMYKKLEGRATRYAPWGVSRIINRPTLRGGETVPTEPATEFKLVVREEARPGGQSTTTSSDTRHNSTEQ